jgi:hypothetical protein
VTNLLAVYFGVRIPAGGKIYLFFQDAQIGTGVLPFKGYYFSSAPLIRRQEPEFGNSSTSRGEVKNEWSSDSISSWLGQGQLCLLYLCPIDITVYTLSYRISIPRWGKSILTETTWIQTPTTTSPLSDGLNWPQRDG